MATAKQALWSWKEPTNWKTTRLEEVLVTPELAQYIYDNLGDFNRRISPTDPKVKEYAGDMLADRWALQNLIEFDWNGRLANGYHRMLAVILAGVPIKFFFRYGADPKDYVYFDKGKNRDGQDTMEVEAQRLGEKLTAQDAKLLSSAMPWIIQYECGKASLPFRITSYHQREFYVKRFSEKKGEDFDVRQMLPLCRKAAKRLGVAESVVFALMVLGSRVTGMKGKTRDFWQGVATGANLPNNDARLMYRERIENIRLEAKRIHAKLQRDPVYLLGLKCMRAFFDDKKIGNLIAPKEITRLSGEHDQIFDPVDFVSPYGEPTVFEASNVKTVEELIEKHEDRGK